jgi:hypothetical protein
MRAEWVASSATPPRALPAMSGRKVRGWARPELSVGALFVSWWTALWADLVQFWNVYVAPYVAWWFLAIVVVFIVIVVAAYAAGEDRGERIGRRRTGRE